MSDHPVDDLKYWVALHRVSGLGPVRFSRLETFFGTMEQAWNATRADLISSGIDRATADEVAVARSQIDPDREMELNRSHGVTAIHRRSPDYPALLGESPDAPSVIYLKGRLEATDQRGVAIVGTRSPTVYGREMARRISSDLAGAGVTVYSGLARGIDGEAHRSALGAGGRTVAVMGGGLDSIYPPEHASIAGQIEQQGAVVSEYPVGTRPKAEHFPRRNRLISGLSLGVVVVEADMDSGAMITVKWALEQDREVFAVPGSALSPRSNGPNWLIQQGAKLVTTYRDILEELNIAVMGMSHERPRAGTAMAYQAPSAPRQASRQAVLGLEGHGDATKENREEKVLAALAGGPAHVDEIIRATGLGPSEVSSIITLMELRGAVRQIGPMQFIAEAVRTTG